LRNHSLFVSSVNFYLFLFVLNGLTELFTDVFEVSTFSFLFFRLFIMFLPISPGKIVCFHIILTSMLADIASVLPIASI